jgi:hypothetical protein
MEVIIEVKNTQEFEKLCDEDDIQISSAIVNAILSNIYNKKKRIYILSIHMEESDEIFDVTLERIYFVSTLREHLPVQEKNECFETCQCIIKGIDYLESLSLPLGRRK